MGEALAIPFVKEKLGAEGKAVTKDLVQKVEAAMQVDLAVALLDGRRRRATRALEKLHKIVNKIGYPDEWRNYDALRVDRKSYVANAMRAVAVRGASASSRRSASRSTAPSGR